MKNKVLKSVKRNEALVSVVVPIYNVDKYLGQCIDSIINQSYERIEIILVDDGSTDSSGKICDDYSKKDKRIKVIHKKNGGVSSARNVGLDNANGSFICFVDSDDYLDKKFVNYMMKLYDKTGADFCLSKKCYSTKSDLSINNMIDNIQTIDSLEATRLLLSPEVFVGCWNKMFKLDFLRSKKIRFCEELFYGEGLKFIINAAQATDKIGVGTERVYYYRINNMNSATKKFNFKKYENGIKSLDMIKAEIIKSNILVEHQLYIHYCFFYFNTLFDLINNGKKQEFKSKYVTYRNKFRQYGRIVLKYRDLHVKQKIKILLMLIFPKILVKIISYRQGKKVENSI